MNKFLDQLTMYEKQFNKKSLRFKKLDQNIKYY